MELKDRDRTGQNTEPTRVCATEELATYCVFALRVGLLAASVFIDAEGVATDLLQVGRFALQVAVRLCLAVERKHGRCSAVQVRRHP